MRPPSAAVLALVGLLVIDIAYIGMDLTQNWILGQDQWVWRLEGDRSYPEMFGYIKLAWSALLVIVAARTQQAKGLLVWVLVFGYILVDDFFLLHERVGESVAARYELPPVLGLRGNDLPEIGFVLGVGLVLLVGVAVAYWRSTPDMRWVHRDLVVLLFGQAARASTSTLWAHHEQ